MATLISSLRILTHDGPTDHVIFSEKLGTRPDGFTVNGTNKVFRLGGEDGHSLPLVASSVFISTGATQRSQSGFTQTDNVNGFITFATAPPAGIDVFADYNYYWFSDAQYTEFLNEAAQTVQAGVADATVIITGLTQSLLQYALASFFKSRASQYAERYSTSGGEVGQSVEAVAKIFLSLSKEASARGKDYRDEYYTRQGARNAPAQAIGNYRIDPITPPR
jgi:hypothetical protein